MVTPPTIIYPLTLPSLLHHVLSTQSDTLPTTLIVCSTKDAFLQGLVDALQLQQGQGREKLMQLATPTLYNLFTARHVKVAFCASVQTLLAYLTARAGTVTLETSVSDQASERIVLVNPLALHASTPSFSAQGLSRTFAAAVEMALRLHAVLVVAECQGGWMLPIYEDKSEHEDAKEGRIREPRVGLENPWEQEVSILNVSAKRFGSGTGDRAWAGRTVKVKRVAGRWFRFRNMDHLDMRERPV